MQAFKKHLLIGSGPYGSVYVTVKWNGEKLSLTGVEGPRSNGNCIGSCGQCREAPMAVTKFADGWGATSALTLVGIWNRWHLNDMQAGSPAQEAFLRDNPESVVQQLEAHKGDHYLATKAALELAGIQPDHGHIVDGAPYHYGSRWLFEPVPANVIEWLAALPEASVPMPSVWS